MTTTGAQSLACETALDQRHRVCYGRPGIDFMPYSILLGCLDAPDELPAGAMNSTEWVNGRGDPIPHQTTTRRNAAA